MLPDVPQSGRELSLAVGVLLRERMESSGVSQMQVAAAIGVSQSVISRSLTGIRRWNLDQFAAVCMFLGTKASDVIAVAEDTIGDL